MQIMKLSRREYDILVKTLEETLGNLRVEIRHTDGMQYREMLKGDQELLTGIRGKLKDMNLPEPVNIIGDF